MSQRRIKKKPERREKELAFLASQIGNQESLEVLLSVTAPLYRAAVFEKYLPFLPFTPLPDTLERVHARISRKETEAGVRG